MNLHTPSSWQIKKILVLSGMAVLAFSALTIFYWSVSGNDVLDVKNAPFPVRTIREHPTADGVVILKTEYCKNISASGRVRVSFFNPSREVFLPISTDKQDAGCYELEVPILIPKDLPPGEYRIKFRVTYQVNPIKSVVEEFDSKKFQVVP